MNGIEWIILIIVAITCIAVLGTVFIFEVRRENMSVAGNLLAIQDPVDGEWYFHLELKSKARIDEMTHKKRVVFNVKELPYPGDKKE